MTSFFKLPLHHHKKTVLEVNTILQSKYNFWLVLSIITAILFSLGGLKLAFHSPYTIQDDARQHIFWMQQFNDRDLFPRDLIADYFESVTPWGFAALYKLVASLGIDVIFFNKISPFLIGIVTTIYCFHVCLEIFPVPFAGFISSLLLNQNLWMVDDLSSGTPRAFIYPLFLASIYYLLRANLLLYLLVIVLQGLFYPPTVLLSAAILFFRLSFHRDRRNRRICFLGLLTAFAILYTYAIKTFDFEPLITVTQAKFLPEFLDGGRTAFFVDDPIQFWLLSRRSGLFPIEWQYTLMCAYQFILFLLKQYPVRFRLVGKINQKAIVLLQILLASLLMYFLARIFLFRLHLPSRYSHHTLRMIIAIGDGVAIAVIFDPVVRWLDRQFNHYGKLLKSVGLIALICLLLYPTYAVQSYPYRLGYVTPKTVEIYQFLQQQPKDSLIATLSEDGDFIPSLAGRSTLVAPEYSIPYHWGYYQKIRQRVKDLIQAQYSTDIETVKKFIQKYQINFWLIDKNAFTINYLKDNPWLRQFQPETFMAIEMIAKKENLILAELGSQCQVFADRDSVVIQADCILARDKKNNL